MPNFFPSHVAFSGWFQRLLLFFLLTAILSSPGGISPLQAQSANNDKTPAADSPAVQSADATEVQSAPNTVEVQPRASDAQISQRLQRILMASDWFEKPSVRVEQGIAFISGFTDTDDRKEWAGNLARNTRDVVAVVNHIQVKQPSLFDWTPAVQSLRDLLDSFIRRLPLILFGIVVLVAAWFLGRGATALIRHSFSNKGGLNHLLREVIARATGFGVFLLGLYLVLLVVGLARLALTVLGGTGLIGLVIGIAFRDITENFLASIFLSIQRPFRAGDLIEVEDNTGFVQRLTVRTTNLMSLDGNVIQIPNSTVYKSILHNFSSNPNRREIFTIGIGYDDSVTGAQEVAMKVLKKHPAVLTNPDPWVLVNDLGPSTVNLKIYFWLDGSKHSWLKVRSSVIRLVKHAFQEQGISMPDEAREIIVNREVPVSVTLRGVGEETNSNFIDELLDTHSEDEPLSTATTAPEASKRKLPQKSDVVAQTSAEPEAISTSAEGSLTSEAEVAESQAQNVKPPDDEVNLLK